MKRILIGLSAFVAVVAALTGCSTDKVTYNGPEYVIFSDTLSYFPVQNSEDWFNVPVASTVTVDYDRTFAVEVDDKRSNAVERKHYVIESNTVVIKAGERAANVRIKGIYENIDKTDSLAVTFRLLAKEDSNWKLYGTTTRVEMMKSCPFDINVFKGYCLLKSNFFQQYMVATERRLLKTVVDEKEPNTVILKDFYYSGYNLKLKFDPSNPLEPFVEMDPQMLGTTAEAFGTIYGNGKLMFDRATAAASFYNVCQKFVLLYISVYVENIGVVGTYVNVMEWISDEEAEQIIKEGI